MKRIFLLIIVLFLLVGCTKEKFKLEEKYYNTPSFEEIDATKLNELEKNNESFLVMVYTTGCFSCMDFEKVLNEFTEENKLQVFRINITDIDNSKLANKIKYTPSLVIYKEGNVYKYLDANSNKDVTYYKSIDDLKKWLDKYIEL